MACGGAGMVRKVCLVDLVCLVCLVYLVCLVDLVHRSGKGGNGLSRLFCWFGLFGLFGLSCWEDRTPIRGTRETKPTRQTKKRPTLLWDTTADSLRPLQHHQLAQTVLSGAELFSRQRQLPEAAPAVECRDGADR